MTCPVIGDDDKDGEEEVDQSLALNGDEMIGAASDVRKADVRRPKAIPSPSEPTAKEIELHNLSHMPYRSWCPFCIAGRRNNSGHRATKQDRKIPLVVADYAAVRNQRDQDLLTFLVVRLYPQRVTFACVVD